MSNENTPITPTDKVQAALNAATAAAKTVADWEARSEAAQAAVDRLEQQAGARVLDDPQGAQGLIAELTEARSALAVALAAIPEAIERARVAKATACRVEADDLERERKRAEAAVGKFDARTAELLQALEEHTGRPWRMFTAADEIEEARLAGNLGGTQVHAGARFVLTRAVEAVKRQQQLLRGVAAGQAVLEVLPDASWDDLGQCLRPGGPADVGWSSPEDEAREAAREAEEAVTAARQELEASLAEAIRVARAWDDEAQDGRGATQELVDGWAGARERLRRAQQRWHNTPGAEGVAPEALTDPPLWPTRSTATELSDHPAEDEDDAERSPAAGMAQGG